VAAEEEAKAAAAKKVTAEEVAKKSAALKVAAKENARAASKSPEQLRSMEAQAFEAAAKLKTKEAEALSSLAAMKGADGTKKAAKKAVASEATDKVKLTRAKAKLQGLMKSANSALRKAQAKPFSKSALKAIVKKRSQVKSAKQLVITLSNRIKGDKAQVKKGRKPGKAIVAKSKERARKATKKGKKYDLKHPNLKHMTRKQVKYWANKRLKWRSEDPLKKTKVMAKIFKVKNQEAKTLEKMNELNIRVGMKSKGIRASMLKKGRTAIVNGELIKAKAKYNINRAFQGQKGVDPKLSPPTRDPRTDKLKKLNGKHMLNRMKKNTKKMAKAINAAKSARKDNGKPINKKKVNRLKALKKAVKKNKQVIAKKPTELGDADQDDDEIASQDEADADAAIERGDDDAMNDDTAVDMAMDANDVDDDIDSVDRDEEDEDEE
jgi:hypothetical protein